MCAMRTQTAVLRGWSTRDCTRSPRVFLPRAFVGRRRDRRARHDIGCPSESAPAPGRWPHDELLARRPRCTRFSHHPHPRTRAPAPAAPRQRRGEPAQLAAHCQAVRARQAGPPITCQLAGPPGLLHPCLLHPGPACYRSIWVPAEDLRSGSGP